MYDKDGEKPKEDKRVVAASTTEYVKPSSYFRHMVKNGDKKLLAEAVIRMSKKKRGLTTVTGCNCCHGHRSHKVGCEVLVAERILKNEV